MYCRIFVDSKKVVSPSKNDDSVVVSKDSKSPDNVEDDTIESQTIANVIRKISSLA